MSGDQISVVMLGDRQLRKHAGWSGGAPLLAGCREEYHDLQGLIRPGGLAIRSCDPHICIHTDQPSRLVGMRGDFQRKGKVGQYLFRGIGRPRAQICGQNLTQFQSVIQLQ
jgi:hypothetical protein